MDKAVSCCDSWQFQVEGLPLVVTTANRDVFVKNAALYHAVLQRQSCLDQLIDGLSYYGVRFTSQFCIMLAYRLAVITLQNVIKALNV